MSRTEPKVPPRRYSVLANRQVRQLLELLREETPVPTYRETMHELGKALGEAIKPRLRAGRQYAVVTAPEDADFLTRGVVQVLPRDGSHLACFWTERHRFEQHPDTATVSQSYVDPTMPTRIDSVVIVKSIISTGCVVRAQLEQFLLHAQPRQVIIAAPVMRKGADSLLRSEFSPSLASRFRFLTFAKDSKLEGENIVPGVGGQVYERLGFERASKRRIRPELVRAWRAASMPQRA